MDRQRIFLDEEDRRRFVLIAIKVFREFGVQCLAWALMGNHYHLLVQPRRTRLGPVLHKLNLIYAQYFNEKYERTGHLFENRFWRRLSEDDGAFRRQVRYIHTNPLRAGIVPDLAALESYPWTGHAELIGCSSPRLLSRQEVLARFASDTRDTVQDVRDYFADGVRPIRIAEPTLDCALSEACRVSGVRRAEVLSGERTEYVSRVRTLSIYLAVEQAGLGIRATARGLGISPVAVRKAIRRAKSRKIQALLPVTMRARG